MGEFGNAPEGEAKLCYLAHCSVEALPPPPPLQLLQVSPGENTDLSSREVDATSIEVVATVNLSWETLAFHGFDTRISF